MEKETGNKDKADLIHCITNPIAMNQSANAVLALGASPIMAEHPKEVREITHTASALLINLGNITDTRMEAMRISIDEANRCDIPVVIDAVGVACSKLRREFIGELLAGNRSRVIKGNHSEIMALSDHSYGSRGVDADKSLSEVDVEAAARRLSSKYEAIVVATGKTDLVVSGDEVIKVKGGCEQLSSVTGTGCMLGAVIATFLAKEDSVDSVAKACRFFKDCGLWAKTYKGGGTFMANLIDAIGVRHGA